MFKIILAFAALCCFSVSGQVCDFCRNPFSSCQLVKADVAVLFESSNFTSPALLSIMKIFTRNLFNSFSLGECTVRTALVRSGADPEALSNFNSFLDDDGIFTVVDSLQKGVSFDTNLAAGLEYVRESVFTEDMGSRATATKILVVLTDNLPMPQESLSSAAAAVRAEGINIVAIGVGDNVEPSVLRDITDDDVNVAYFSDVVQLSGPQALAVRNTVCRFEQTACQEATGGCSHTCVVTSTSFSCACPDGFVLEDEVNCINASLVTEASNDTNTSKDCSENNGNCCQVCTTTEEGGECGCYDGFALNADNRTCSDVNECFDFVCSHACFNTIGSFFCECPEDHELSEDRVTCVPRPGPADCSAGFEVVSHSCMVSTEGALAYADAENYCSSNVSSRLAKIADDGTRALVTRFFPGKTWIGLQNIDGTWTNSDGTPFTYEWAYGEPKVGKCGFVQNLIRSAHCGNLQRGACEQPREKGIVIYGHRWDSGVQGKLYMPTDVNEVKVIFPKSISRFQVWYGKISKRINAREYVVTQDDIERQSNNGHVGFVIFFRRYRFPDYDITIEPYSG